MGRCGGLRGSHDTRQRPAWLAVLSRRASGDFRLRARTRIRRDDANARQGRLEFRSRHGRCAPATTRASEQMLKSMLQFRRHGEPAAVRLVAARDERAARCQRARMMSLMSNEQEFEVLAGYRFQRRSSVSAGARKAPSTSAARCHSNPPGRHPGVTVALSGVPRPATRHGRTTCGLAAACSTSPTAAAIGSAQAVSPASSMASGPAVACRGAQTRCTAVCGSDRRGPQAAGCIGGVQQATSARSVFVGPTTLLLYKAFAFEAGVLFPAYQRVDAWTRQGAVPRCRQLELFLLAEMRSAHESNRFWRFSRSMLVATPARAELRHVEIKTLGMD